MSDVVYGTVLQVFATAPVQKSLRCVELLAVPDYRISRRLLQQMIAMVTRHGLLQVSSDIWRISFN